jgi:hypothetical protein
MVHASGESTAPAGRQRSPAAVVKAAATALWEDGNEGVVGS